jgi:hypothetical protein
MRLLAEKKLGTEKPDPDFLIVVSQHLSPISNCILVFFAFTLFGSVATNMSLSGEDIYF